MTPVGFRNPITTAIDQTARDAAAHALDVASNGIIPGTRLAADAIDGHTITGATVRTAASGARVALTSAGLTAYDSTGATVTRVSTADGTLTATSATVGGTLTADGGVSWPAVSGVGTPWAASSFTPPYPIPASPGPNSPLPTWSLVGPTSSPTLYGSAATPRLDLAYARTPANAPTSTAKVTADTITLAGTVIAGGDWTYDLRNSTYNYPATAGTWTTIPSGSVSVTVPAGAVLDVEFYVPAGIVAAGGDLAVRLNFDSTLGVDGAELQCGAAARAPLRLAGSIPGGSTGRTVAVAVQAQAVAGSCSLAATANAAVTLRHRIR